MRGRFSGLALAFASALSVGAANAEPLAWAPARSGIPLPLNALPGGDNGDGTPLYVCRAAYKGGMHPGKVYAGNCNIGWGGKEIVLSSYEVLIGMGVWRADRRGWVVGGDNGDGTPLGICRAGYRGGMHPGKMLAGKCNIGWGGAEVVLTGFEALAAR